MAGTLFLVATPIGNLEDITARALRVLGSAAVIAAEDTRRTAHLLARYAITTPTTSLHEHNERRKAPALLDRLRAGQDVALVSDAGTPLISDPGQHLVRLAIDAGIRVEPVPGPSAIIAALAASGFATQPFTFLGFPPTRSKDRHEWLDILASTRHSVVFFESPHRIRQTLTDIQRRIGDCGMVLCRELSKIHEELVRGQISSVLNHDHIETGELTAVLDCGQLTESVGVERPSDTEMAHLVGQMMNKIKISRRQAVQRLAKQYGRKPNEIYSAIEKSKSSV